MKNNHGWGMNEMIVFCCILIGFLLLVVILVNSLYSDLSKTEKKIEEEQGFSYKEVESHLKDAAKKYYRDNKGEELEYINAEDLLNLNYISKEQLTPSKENDYCTGYVTITDEVVFRSYITCDNYETEGF